MSCALSGNALQQDVTWISSTVVVITALMESCAKMRYIDLTLQSRGWRRKSPVSARVLYNQEEGGEWWWGERQTAVINQVLLCNGSTAALPSSHHPVSRFDSVLQRSHVYKCMNVEVFLQTTQCAIREVIKTTYRGAWSVQSVLELCYLQVTSALQCVCFIIFNSQF